jgi:hypothetical protein
VTPEVLDAGIGVDRGRLAALTAREADAFAAVRPRSRELADRFAIRICRALADRHTEVFAEALGELA